MPPLRAGLIAIVLIAIGTYFAFARGLPFRSHYEIEAVFRSANNVKERQPVRIAGVDVGKVVEVGHPEPGSRAAVITDADRGRGAPDPQGRDACRSGRGCSSRATGSSTSSPARRAAGELPDGGHDAGPADARPRCSSARSSPRSSRTRARTSRRCSASTRARSRARARTATGARSSTGRPPTGLGDRAGRDARRVQHDLSEYIDAAAAWRAGSTAAPSRSRA